jgi:hypothetical protein
MKSFPSRSLCHLVGENQHVGIPLHHKIVGQVLERNGAIRVSIE